MLHAPLWGDAAILTFQIGLDGSVTMKSAEVRQRFCSISCVTPSNPEFR